MATDTEDFACKTGIAKGKLWKFMTGQKPEFQQIRVGFKGMGQQFIQIWAAVDRHVMQKRGNKEIKSHK
jgi:predicted transcriptional regulator